jgi:L-ascorbate 6-phosphate lactonase
MYLKARRSEMNDISWHNSGHSLIDEISAEQIPENTFCIWPLGQCGFILKTAGAVIGIDLVLSQLYGADGQPRRQYLPPFTPEAGLHLSRLLITHNHKDHLDLPTIRGLLQTNSDLRVLLPRAVKDEVPLDDARIIYVKQNEPVSIPGGTVTGIATAHDVYRSDAEGCSYSLGYIIRQQGTTVFHSGDALADSALLQNVSGFNPDIVFLPINGRDEVREKAGIIGNMTMEEAVSFAKQLSPEVFIPMHYDMFANNGFDVETCRTYSEKMMPHVKTVVPLLGKKIVIKL